MRKLEQQNSYTVLLAQIKNTVDEGKTLALKMVRRQLVLTYWAIGKNIVEFEQQGNEKAVYGSKVLDGLSKDLSDQLGRGFSRTNLIYMRLCFIKYSDINILSDQLSWGHVVDRKSVV